MRDKTRKERDKEILHLRIFLILFQKLFMIKQPRPQRIFLLWEEGEKEDYFSKVALGRRLTDIHFF